MSTPAIVLSHVPTLPPPNQHPTAQHHDITQSTTPTAYQGYIQHYNYTSQRQQTPWLYYGEQENMIQPHGSNCYLAQAGRTYINNGCNQLQEFDPKFAVFHARICATSSGSIKGILGFMIGILMDVMEN